MKAHAALPIPLFCAQGVETSQPLQCAGRGAQRAPSRIASHDSSLSTGTGGGGARPALLGGFPAGEGLAAGAAAGVGLSAVGVAGEKGFSEEGGEDDAWGAAWRVASRAAACFLRTASFAMASLTY